MSSIVPLVDIHMHTLYSDGILPPAELIKLAKSNGVDIMCINDHDTVKGVMEMLTLDVSGITVLCGIEMSSTLAGVGCIHIAGYFPRDTNFATFQKELDEKVSQRRIERGQKIVSNLQKGGYEITWEEVLEECKNSLPSRPRIAAVLLKHGYIKTIAEAFDELLSTDSKYYVRGDYLQPNEVVDLIHKYNGIASLAHPWLYKKCDYVLDYITTTNIDGMECFPPSHHAETGTTKYIDFAHAHNYIVTSGSDYHGTKNPEVTPGHNIFPEDERMKTLQVFKDHHIL